MSRFRDYKDYANDTNVDDFNRWTINTSYNLLSSVPTRTIIRSLGDIIKYGRVKKEVLQ